MSKKASLVYLLIEPFYGGSHRMLMDMLHEALQDKTDKQEIHFVSLSAKKWHWRARTSALYFAQEIPTEHSFRVLFTSSVLNLAELIALRPDLRDVKKIVYFHENQLVYPVRKNKDRDFQYGYNQILTCLVADVILFNSNYNQDSFLNSINTFFKLQPDFRPKNLKNSIVNKCRVLYFPVPKICNLVSENDSRNRFSILHIVWPHRWEHDKNPDMFFNVLFSLASSGFQFKVSILGESFERNLEIFDEAKTQLTDHIINWGHLENKIEYYKTLQNANVSVSTADHEFFGVAMLETVLCGCFPLCPNNLVYPEIYPKQCLFKSSDDLLRLLKEFSLHPEKIQYMVSNLDIDFSSYMPETLIPQYLELFNI